jgi:rod shape determining protein RodA
MKKLFFSVRHYDWWLFTCVFILTIFGILIIYSVGTSTESAGLIKFYKQIIFAVFGIIALLLISCIDYRFFSNYAYILYALGILILISVLFSSPIRGTAGWFVLGPISIQPVEIAKIFLVIFLARFFSLQAFSMDRVKNIIISVMFVGIYVFLVLLQPDLGSALIFIALWIGFLLLSNANKKQLIILALILAIIAISSWFIILKDYQKERILTFIDPSRDSLDTGYNVIQSITAIGSGKLFGRGLGLGPQSQLDFLPEQEADFIFAVICEELGFFGALMIIIFFTFIFYRIWNIAKNAHDDFTSYFAYGILIIIFFQSIINIGMNIGIMPVTGLPLPWISAGGSSLLVNMILIGLLESVYQHENLT